MGIEDEVINKHLQLCKIICNDKGYSQLDFQREKVKRDVLKYFNQNGYDLNRVSQILYISDIAIFHYLDTNVMNRGSRPLFWPDYHEEEIIKEINTALQQA